MRISRAHRAAVTHFVDHWRRFADLQPYHTQWAAKHIRYRKYRKGELIYAQSFEQEKVFYVASGLLARVLYAPLSKCEKEKRAILSVGLPHMALMTTNHLYSDTQGTGEIIALRPSEVLSVSYHQIKSFLADQDDRSLSNMITVLVHKKIAQLSRLRTITPIADPYLLYDAFTKKLPELHHILNQTEMQDLLGISRSSIQRASLFQLKHEKQQN